MSMFNLLLFFTRLGNYNFKNIKSNKLASQFKKTFLVIFFKANIAIEIVLSSCFCCNLYCNFLSVNFVDNKLISNPCQELLSKIMII